MGLELYLAYRQVFNKHDMGASWWVFLEIKTRFLPDLSLSQLDKTQNTQLN